MTRVHDRDVVVKDQFHDITFRSGEEMVVCNDCYQVLCGPWRYEPKAVLVVIEPHQYEEVQCEQCSAVSPVTAYYDEIKIRNLTDDEYRIRNVTFGNAART